MEGTCKYKCPLRGFLKYLQDCNKEYYIYLNYNETGY